MLNINSCDIEGPIQEQRDGQPVNIYQFFDDNKLLGRVIVFDQEPGNHQLSTQTELLVGSEFIVIQPIKPFCSTTQLLRDILFEAVIVLRTYYGKGDYGGLLYQLYDDKVKDIKKTIQSLSSDINEAKGLIRISVANWLMDIKCYNEILDKKIKSGDRTDHTIKDVQALAVKYVEFLEFWDTLPSGASFIPFDLMGYIEDLHKELVDQLTRYMELTQIDEQLDYIHKRELSHTYCKYIAEQAESYDVPFLKLDYGQVDKDFSRSTPTPKEGVLLPHRQTPDVKHIVEHRLRNNAVCPKCASPFYKSSGNDTSTWQCSICNIVFTDTDDNFLNLLNPSVDITDTKFELKGVTFKFEVKANFFYSDQFVVYIEDTYLGTVRQGTSFTKDGNRFITRFSTATGDGFEEVVHQQPEENYYQLFEKLADLFQLNYKVHYTKQ